MKTNYAMRFLRAAVLLAAFWSSNNLAHAQSCNVEWTGDAGDGGQWSNAKNWSPHKVPGPTSDVCILTANGTSGSVLATTTPSISVNSIQLGKGVGSPSDRGRCRLRPR
jgi:hypothetical protein